MSTTKDIVSSFAEISKLMDLAEKRKIARENKDWTESDRLRDEIQQKGYTISKSGTTTQTETTTIINRTNQASSTSKDLKNILGAGIIQTGSDNSKVDYTIIIGEDCK